MIKDYSQIISFIRATFDESEGFIPLHDPRFIGNERKYLNLTDGSKISNAALLLFGKRPQKFFISSEVRCAHFHDYDVVKPIPNYQVYKDDL